MCICYIQRTYAHLLFICCSCKRQNTSFPYLPVLVRIPSSIMIPFLGLSTAALLIATGWQVRLITAVKTPYLPDGKIDLEAPRPLFVSATRPKLEIRNWPQAHHKRCISILCKGFSQLFCIKMSTPNWSILVDIEKTGETTTEESILCYWNGEGLRKVTGASNRQWGWCLRGPGANDAWLSPDSMVETCWNMLNQWKNAFNSQDIQDQPCRHHSFDGNLGSY